MQRIRTVSHCGGTDWSRVFARHGRGVWLTIVLIALGGCSSSRDAEEVQATASALTSADVWGMDDPARWSLSVGTLRRTTNHTEGTSAFSVSAPRFTELKAAAVSKPSLMSPRLAVDVSVPTQAGPSNFGAVQMFVTAPSLNIFRAWVGQVQLGPPTGSYQTVTFILPADIYSTLLAKPFNDLSVSIALNPPPGVTSPFLFDNLRIVPAPGCVGLPDGTFCDDVTACTTGTTCAAGICGTRTTPACDPANDVMGFENLAAWNVTIGQPILSAGTTHVQGAQSLSVRTTNFATVASIPLSTLHKVGRQLSLSVVLPTSQPNPFWFGTIALAMSAPSLGISMSVQQELTGQATGTFVNLLFAVPADVYQSLATHSYADLTFSIAINPPGGQSGSYRLDDLHFVPVATCTGALDNTACEDGSACTAGDACVAGICGAVVVCDDGNVCTDDSCSPATGCVFTNNTAPCDDASVCTTGDSCAGGACVGGPPLDCDDGSGCTSDSCDPASGCGHVNACATYQTCASNACCTPTTCAQAKLECGSAVDGCGGTLDCGACPGASTCSPTGQCLPPANVADVNTGVNVCELLLKDLIIPQVVEDVTSCKSFSDAACFAFYLAGQPCCVPGACLTDPVCTITKQVVTQAEQIFNAGSVYCSSDNISAADFFYALAGGQVENLADVIAGGVPASLSLLYGTYIQILTAVGRPIPDNVQTILADLISPIYDGGVRGFSFADMQNVKIVSSDFPTARPFFPGTRFAMTLGQVVVLRADFYSALVDPANANITFNDLLSGQFVDVFASEVAGTPNFLDAVGKIAHELVHVKQYRNLGQDGFLESYVLSSIDYEVRHGGVGMNAFEKEAFTFGADTATLAGWNYCKSEKPYDDVAISAYGLPNLVCLP